MMHSVKLPNKTPSKLSSFFKRGKTTTGHKVVPTTFNSRSSTFYAYPDEHKMKFALSRSSSMSDADEEILLVDKFGFVIDTDPETSSMSTVLTTDEDKIAPVSIKGFQTTAHTHSMMKDMALKVGPGKSWAAMLGLDGIIAKNQGTYNDLVAMSASDPDQNQDFLLGDVFRTEWEDIERDLKRTFPTHCFFREEDSKNGNKTEGKQALRRILRAYSMYDREIGYCQGMNFIAGMLLTFLSEEESFWLLVVVMNDEPYTLREVFSREMAGTHEVLYIADKLVNCFLPELYEHFEDEHVHTSMFTTQWLMTLFTSTFPFELVSRVWDSFIAEGWKIVYRTLIALLKHAQNEGDLLNKSMEEILAYLRGFQSKVDAEQILSAADKIPLKQRHIQTFASEFRKLRDNGELEVHEVLRRSDSASVGSSSASLQNMSKFHRFVIKLKHSDREISVQDLSPKLVPVVGSDKFVVLLKDALSPGECASLLKRVKAETFQDVLIRQQNESSDFIRFRRTNLEDEELADVLYGRIVSALRMKPELWERFSEAAWSNKGTCSFSVSRLNQRFQCLKFEVGDKTPPHSDSRYSSANEESRVTLHVYLNSNYEGGITSFSGIGSKSKKFVDINAKVGDILLFDQDLRHEKCEVVKGKRFVLRTEVMYADQIV